MNQLKSILVPVDFSPASAAALQQALRIAQWNRATVHALHVVGTMIVLELQEALTVIQQGIVDQLIADAKGMWKDFAAKVPGAADLPPSPSSSTGPPSSPRAPSPSSPRTSTASTRRPAASTSSSSTAPSSSGAAPAAVARPSPAPSP